MVAVGIECVCCIHSGKLTWQWKNGPFEDVFPIENGDIPLLCSFTRGYVFFKNMEQPEVYFWKSG